MMIHHHHCGWPVPTTIAPDGSTHRDTCLSMIRRRGVVVVAIASGIGMRHKQGTQKCDPHNGINQIGQPTQIETYKLFKIVASDTRAHPDTMMIKTGDTDVTIGTMDAIGWLKEFANVTPTMLGPLAVVVVIR